MARHGENIRKRKDGRWEARVLCGYKEDGRASYKYIYRRTYTEVKAAKNQLLAQLLAGHTCHRKTPQSSATFDILLTDWLCFIRPKVKESTYVRYAAMISKHIRPELGNLLLKELTSRKIDQFTYKKLEQGNLKNQKGLSPKTVAGLLSVIRLALNYGIEREYDCPVHLVIHNPRQKISDIQILTREEQKRLEQVLMLEDDQISLGIMISLYLGLRIGEVCALRWEDLDIENAVLYVKRSIQRISDPDIMDLPGSYTRTKILIDTPKTNGSIRGIPIPFFLLSVFKRHQAEADCYVLTGSFVCLEPRKYYRKYKKLMKKCCLEHFNYHALRHTFATRCVENDFDIKSLSEILGHANVSTTLQRYVHPSLSLKRRHMDRLGSIAICGHESGPIVGEEQIHKEMKASV